MVYFIVIKFIIRKEWNMSKVLIADDELAIAELISDALGDEGIDSVICGNGDDAVKLIDDGKDFSLILLDIMMPGADGLEVCRRIRDKISCPIIFLTAKNRTVDTLVGLNMGADDYITKPFIVDELIARIKAHLRREERKNVPEDEGTVIGDLCIYLDRYTVLKNGRAVSLSSREFQLLAYLAKNRDKVLSKEQIYESVWGTKFGDIGTVAVNIKNLRTKLDPDELYIKTVWGVGYIFTGCT